MKTDLLEAQSIEEQIIRTSLSSLKSDEREFVEGIFDWLVGFGGDEGSVTPVSVFDTLAPLLAGEEDCASSGIAAAAPKTKRRIREGLTKLLKLLIMLHPIVLLVVITLSLLALWDKTQVKPLLMVL